MKGMTKLSKMLNDFTVKTELSLSDQLFSSLEGKHDRIKFQFSWVCLWVG